MAEQITMDLGVIIGLIVAFIVRSIVGVVIETIMDTRSLRTELKTQPVIPMNSFEEALKTVATAITTIILGKIEGDKPAFKPDPVKTIPAAAAKKGERTVGDELQTAIQEILKASSKQSQIIESSAEKIKTIGQNVDQISVDFTNILSTINLKEVLSNPDNTTPVIKDPLDGGTFTNRDGGSASEDSGDNDYDNL